MSKIIITDDYDRVIEEIKPDEVIRADELKIDDVKTIRDLAYIAEKHKKVILIAAEKYSVVSQNALLKLLEEPPKNIDFILLAKSKYALLDTIKSRMITETKTFNKELQSDIDVSSITNDKILQILQQDLDNNEIKAFIYKILKEKNLNEEQMEILSNAVKMIELNIDKKAVMAMIMLSIKERI
ncbi:DNA polymerase III subunit delta' [Nautilia lithotrophica]